MFIRNKMLAEILNSELRENSRQTGAGIFYFDRLPDSREIYFDTEDLKKMTEFVLALDRDTMTYQEMNAVLKDARHAVKHMLSLEKFALIVRQDDKAPVRCYDLDLSLLELISDGITSLGFENIYLNKSQQNRIPRKFRCLTEIYLNNNYLDNFDIIRKLPEDTLVRLYNNDRLKQKTGQDIYDLVCDRKGRFRSDIIAVRQFDSALRNGTIPLDMFLENADIFLNRPDKDRSYLVDAEKSMTAEETACFEHLLHRISIDGKLIFRGDFEYIRCLLDMGLKNRCTVRINDITDISETYMKKHRNIIGVYISNEMNGIGTTQMYRRHDFIAVKKKIAEIVSDVQPLFRSGLTEKEIFTRIYFSLARSISYDKDLETLEKNGDYSRSFTSRNLIGGLLHNRCVCGGYADILKEVCNHADIHADYVEGYHKDRGHAWNRVKLDGQYYWVDISWDAGDIINENYPLRYFLKSDMDFHHEKYDMVSTFEESLCTRSIDQYEQKKLINSTKNRLGEIFSGYLSEIREVLSGRSISEDAMEIKPVIEKLKTGLYNKPEAEHLQKPAGYERQIKEHEKEDYSDSR